MKTAHQNVPTPQQAQDAANKQYVDDNAGGGGGGVDLQYQPPSGFGPPSNMAFQPLAIKPDGSKVYVGSNNTSQVWRILTSSNTWDPANPESTTLAGSVGWPTLFTMNADGSKLYVVTGNDSTVINIIDTVTNTITGIVSGLSGAQILILKMHPNGTELWVQESTEVVERVDTTTDTVVGTFSTAGVGSQIYDTGFSASGSKYYVTKPFAPQLYIYDATTYTLITTVTQGTTDFIGMCALPDNSEMWILNYDNSDPTTKIYRFSVSTNAQVGTPIPTTVDTSASYFIFVKPDQSKVYQLQAGSGQVNVVSVASHSMVNSIALASASSYGDLEMNAAGTFLYVSSGFSSPSFVDVIDLASETVVATVTAASVTPPAIVDLGTFDTLRITGAELSDAGGGVAEVQLPVVFDTGTTPYQNIKANRTGADASIDDQSKTGITNLGAASRASADYSSIGGGKSNNAGGDYSTVGGGNTNAIGDGYASTISGGDSNTIGDNYAAVIGGGGSNTIDVGGDESVIGGGDGNFINADGAFIGGGYNNQINDSTGVIAGGEDNRVQGFTSAVLGGGSNNVYADFSGIVAGDNNNIGFSNPNSSVDSGILAGRNNLVDDDHSAIVAGENNIINNDLNGAPRSFIGAGENNRCDNGGHSFVGAGQRNYIKGYASAIDSGTDNDLNSDYGFIGSGFNNTINSNSNYSSILGGQENVVSEIGGSVVGNFSEVANNAFDATAIGFYAKAYLEGQLAFAAGDFSNPSSKGQWQVSWLIARSTGISTPAVNAGLFLGQTYNTIQLISGKAYAFRVRAIATGSAGAQAAVLVHEFVVTTAGGIAVIVDQAQITARGSATAKANWTMGLTVTGVDTNVQVVFSSGADGTTTGISVTAHLEFVEVVI